MDRTIRALRLSEKIAETLPVPLLKPVIAAALHIVEAAEVSYTTGYQLQVHGLIAIYRKLALPENDAVS